MKHTPGAEEWLKEDWTVGQYTPTESFRSITNHSCICRKSDMGLIALTGPAEDEESQKLSDLFAAAPEISEALKDCVGELKADWGTSNPAVQEAVKEIVDRAEAAIAKAKGGN